MADDLWDRILGLLAERIPPDSVDTWFRSARISSYRDGRLDVVVPNQFARTYIQEHYSPDLQQVVATLLGTRVRVGLLVDRTVPAAPPPAAPPPPATVELDVRYTFDTFVVGAQNQFAQAACLAVAELPSAAYNPLFIYGGVGLGKTHLLQAIGHQLGRTHPPLRIQYLSAEKFTNDLIAALRYDRMPDFRKRYRTIDLLLLDDIQFLSGKERTQEEFFHTFEDLYQSHRQIVLSSDRSPKEISDIEERLRSRFEWGLIADIQPPDLETRIAILKKKAESDRVPLPDDVAFFIADRVKSNIRELEGSLTRIRAFCTLRGRDLTLGLAQEVLASLWGPDERAITTDDVIRRTAEVFGVKPHDLRAKNRTKAVAFPRQVAMALARQFTRQSYADIGRAFGGKDHTTVLHAVNKIQALLQEDAKLRKTLDHIINTIRVG